MQHEKIPSKIILAGDVGGTNTSLALIEHNRDGFLIRAKTVLRTQSLSGIEPAIEHALATFRERSLPAPDLCCISAAGPIIGTTCRLSNAPWSITSDVVTRKFTLPTYLINDFSAICYGIPLYDVANPEKIAPIAHSDGTLPERRGHVTAVVGAGTGLGVGYLLESDGMYTAFPSEGGHSHLGAFDDETEEFAGFVRARYGSAPGAELFVSGQGIANIFRFFETSGRLNDSSEAKGLAKLTDTEIPAEISARVDSDAVCSQIMKLFARMYGKFAGNAALFFLPTSGVFLAGGIAAKNERLFTETPEFMTAFEDTYKSELRPILLSIPVFIVKDYEISLYGAAHAAILRSIHTAE